MVGVLKILAATSRYCLLGLLTFYINFCEFVQFFNFIISDIELGQSFGVTQKYVELLIKRLDN